MLWYLYKVYDWSINKYSGSGWFWLPGSGSAKICGSTDLDPKGNLSTKNCRKKFTLKPKSELLKNRDYKNFLICSSSFIIKLSEKIRLKVLKFGFLKKKIRTFYGNNLDPTGGSGSFFFQCGSRTRIRIRIKIKWILSTGLLFNHAIFSHQFSLKEP